MTYTWEQATPYMTALHDLVRWAHREIDRAQQGEPLSDVLPLAWANVEKLRAGMVD